MAADPAKGSYAWIEQLREPALILAADDFSILKCNQASTRFLGREQHELLRMRFLELCPAGLRAVAKAKLQRGSGRKEEYTLGRADGSPIYVEFEATPARLGARAAHLCVLHDIGSRTQLVRALLEIDATNREIIENASEIIYTHDLEGHFTSANRAASTLLGYSREEVMQLTVKDLVVEEDLPKAVAATRGKAQGKHHSSPPYQLRVRAKNGQVLTLEVSSRLILQEGSAIGVQGIARDITDRLKAEAALRESESKFRAVAESAPCAMVIYQGKQFKFVNAMAEQITGYSREELLSLSEFWQIVTPDFREVVRRRAEMRLNGRAVPGRFEFTIETKGGEIRWMDFTASLIEFDGAPAAVVMMFDITERKRAEGALLQSEQLFRTVIENSNDIIAIVDGDGTIRYGSPSLLPLLGFAAEELVGTSAYEWMHSHDVPRIRDAFASALRGEAGAGSQRMELRMRARSGEWMMFEAASSVLRDGGRPSGLLINFRDITQRKLAEAGIVASEEKFRQLFEQNLAGVYMSTIHGDVLDCNDSFAEIFGYRSRDEVLQLRGDSFYMSAEDRRGFVERLRLAGSFTNYESLCRRADGMPIWVLENVTLLPGINGGPERIQGTMIDITERKYAEQALVESESKFRAVADTASTAIYIHNGSYFLYVNRACQEITGYSPDELLGMNPFAMVHPDDREMVLSRGSARHKGERVPDRYEYRIVTKSGDTRWVDFSASVIQFEGETAILGTAFDITERKRAEKLQAAMYQIADRANEAEDLQEFFSAIHRIVSELMPARNFFIALHDPVTDRLSFPYFVDEIDAAPDESYFTGRGVTRYVLKTGQPLLVTDEVFKALVAGGEVESVGAASIDWVGAPLRSGGQPFGVIAVQSYSEVTRYTEGERDILHFVAQHLASAILRKRNEEALRDSEQRYRSLVQSAVYGIFRASLDDHFLEANPALITMLGYSTPEELLRLRLTADLYMERDEYRNLLRELQRNGQVDGVEVRWKRQDGKSITVRLSGRAVLDAQGKAKSYEMIAEDVTERRTLEDQLRQSQKMEAVGRLAGGVAHDFNNLLTVIKGYSELILDELQESDPLRSEMEEIQQAAERAATLTRQLLAFSRQQVMAPKVLDLNEVVSNMDKLLRRLLGEDVALSANLTSQLGRVKADPGQIEQVIMNLAVNSRDAMPKGGKLTIETSNIRLDENYAREHVGAKSGDYVMLAVSDNGAGMTEETRQRIFEPFFTTKEMGKGTGLGLSTVYGIIKQSGGYIWVYSEVGVGSTFKVYLPRVDAPADATGSWANLPTRMRGSETILLVEDEDGVRALVRQVLHKHGYSVLEARNAAEAFAHCENRGANIGLLLTDVVLEQMSGRELAEKLAALRPGMKVLYMSGYTDDAIVQLGVLGPGSAFLQKPFTTEALTSKIRQVLDETLV